MVQLSEIAYMPAMSKTDAITKSTDVAVRPESAIYVAEGGELQLSVRIDTDTAWLTQEEIAKLFDVDRSVVTKHIGNVYEEGELERGATRAKFALVRREGRRTVRREVEHYNLDAIISVGYRVNSRTATAFRQWATRVLRERLIGAQHQRQLEQGRLDAVRALASHVLDSEEARALLRVIDRYANSWQILRQYDENKLPDRPKGGTTKRIKRLTLKQAHAAIAALKTELMSKGEASNLFGLERSDGVAAILGNIEQTFGGAPLYPSVEERAAALLYFVIKNHPFTDGNKRIGSLLFLHFLDKNGCLTRTDGASRFDTNALVALALLVAESDPKQKDTVMRLILAMLA